MTNSRMQMCSFTLQPGALKADQFSMLGHFPPQTHRNRALPCWLAFFFSSCRAHPLSCSFASARLLCLPVPACESWPGQSQPGGSSPANRDHLDSSAFSSHHLSTLSLHLPFLKSASPIYQGWGQEARGAVPKSGHSLLPSHPNRVRSLTEPGSSQDGTIRLVGKQ